MTYSLNIRTTRRSEFIDITEAVERFVKKAEIDAGICHIYTPHTTAGLTINENADPSVKKDIMAALRTLIPAEGSYAHREGNSDAHIKASIIGTEKTVLIDEGKLMLGKWQGIFFCEFDGPRTREVWVKMRGE